MINHPSSLPVDAPSPNPAGSRDRRAELQGIATPLASLGRCGQPELGRVA